MDVELFVEQYQDGLEADEAIYVVGNGVAVVHAEGDSAVVYYTRNAKPKQLPTVQGPLTADELLAWLKIHAA